jgi:5-hydroxyisourate hydrolase
MGISTHILDTSLGRPASGVRVSLAIMKNGTWSILNQAVTDSDGRCKHLLPETQALEPGIYRLHFETAAWYKQNNVAGLYPYVEIVFEATDGNPHYHIPLLLTANGYTTYRGS